MRREWKIGDVDVGYVEHTAIRGYGASRWHPYASREIDGIRVDAHFWECDYAHTAAQAEKMCEQMAHVLQRLSPPNDPKLRGGGAQP